MPLLSSPLFDALLARRSGKAHLMEGTGPDPSELEAIVLAASRAPDHGRLVPFRSIGISGKARLRLADLMDAAQVEMQPDCSEAERERAREKATQGPCLVMLVARIDAEHPKIPASDQWLAVGCALENLLLAAQAHGYACAVRSGRFLETRTLREGFAMTGHDQLVSLIVIGKASDYPPQKPKPELSAVFTQWNG